MEEIRCVCGEVITKDDSFSDYDGSFIVPVKFHPTVQSVGKLYKKVNGSTYFEDTGVRPSDVFRQEELELTHMDLDDYPAEECKKHSFGMVLCWTDF